MLGDAETVIDRPIAAGRIEPRGLAQFLRIDAGGGGGRLRRMRSSATKRAQDSKLAGSQRSRTKAFVDQALGDDDMRQRVQNRDVGSGPQRQMIVGLDVRGPDRDRCGADR